MWGPNISPKMSFELKKKNTSWPKIYNVIEMGISLQNLILSTLYTWKSYWPQANASELYFGWPFQGHPDWPYLVSLITCPKIVEQKTHIWQPTLMIHCINLLGSSAVASIHVCNNLQSFCFSCATCKPCQLFPPSTTQRSSFRCPSTYSGVVYSV